MCLLERELELQKRHGNAVPGWHWQGREGAEPVWVHTRRPVRGKAYALECSDWLLLVAPSRAVNPRLTFQVRASYLLRVTPEAAFEAVRAWAETNVIPRMNGVPPEEDPEWKISRLDLAADIVGYSFARDDLFRFATRARRKSAFYGEIEAATEHFLADASRASR